MAKSDKSFINSALAKRNLINCVINAVALVDKGANKKKFYLRKRNGENPMEKSLAVKIIKSSTDRKVWDEVAASVSDEDREDIENLIAVRKAVPEPRRADSKTNSPAEAAPKVAPGQKTTSVSNADWKGISDRIKAIEDALGLSDIEDIEDSIEDVEDVEDIEDAEDVAPADETEDKGNQDIKDICEQLEAMADRLGAMGMGEEDTQDAEKALEFETNKPGGEYGANELKEPPATNKPGKLGPGQAPKLAKALGKLKKALKAFYVPHLGADADQYAGADEKDIKKYLENPDLNIPEHLVAKVINKLN